MGILAIFGRRNMQEKQNDLESIIGKKCVVVEKIDNFSGCGQVKVNGQSWSARAAYEENIFNVGDVLRVVAIEGVKLVCVKN